MARIPTAARKRSGDSDESESKKKSPEDFTANAKIRYVQNLMEQVQVEPVGRLPSEEGEKRKVLRSLALLRAAHYTYVECAQLLGVSENTIGNWLKDPLYQTEQQDLQADARAEGFVGITSLVPRAVEILHSLMSEANSDFVKLKAVELVLKAAGMETPPPAGETDDKRGVAQYLEQIRQRAEATSPQVNLQVILQTQAQQGNELGEGHIVESLDGLPQGSLSAIEQMLLLQQQGALASEYDTPLLPGGRLPGQEESAKS